MVVTLHAAEGLVQFVINHTGFVGKAIGWLFEKIGAGLEKVVDRLLDKLGWEDILHTHDVLFQLFNNKVDEFATYPEIIKQRGINFLRILPIWSARQWIRQSSSLMLKM